MKKVFIYSLSLLLGTTTAYAQTCTPTPDCNALGYTKTVDDCSGDAVKCPFDTSKLFCVDKPSEQRCEFGDIYYSDGTCSEFYETTKNAIGLVYWVGTRGKGGLIMALDEPAGMVWSDAVSYCKSYTKHGVTGWKLPSIRELIPMHNEQIGGGRNHDILYYRLAIIPGAMKSFSTSWSDSFFYKASNGTDVAWYVSGKIRHEYATLKLTARCIQVF